MKNKQSEFMDKLESKVENKGPMRLLVAGLRRMWRLISHNFGLKLLSLLVAVLLWNFVISSNTSYTRTKTINDLTGYVTNQSVLKNYAGLAMLTDPSEKLSDVSVVLEIAQSEYAYASANNVQVTLDLANVRRAGEQDVPLKAFSTYGRVVSIIPETVSVVFETVDARTVPVNVRMVGNPEEDRWYNMTRSNPATLTISGAASLVRNIASAYVYVDVSGMDSSFTVAERYVLLDSAGNEISQDMLDRSSTSISVNMEVYPTREIPISTEIDNVVTGQPADGYEVKSVSIQPQSVVVAAEQDLLDSIQKLHIEPISVQGLTQSFSARADVSSLSSFKSISAEEVYVNVIIAEESVSAWIDNVSLSFVNKREGLSLSRKNEAVRVHVTGPRSVVEKLQQTGIVATVDLDGLDVGTYAVPLKLPEDTYPEVIFTPEQSDVQITLTSAQANP